MSDAFNQWAAQFPEAAYALTRDVLQVLDVADPSLSTPEAYAMQSVELAIARAGGLPMRNNVGATPSRCRECGAKQPVTRYGLLNKTTAQNKQLKSPDIIAILPRLITHNMVGSTIGQFVGVEVKRAGWAFTGAGRESAQAACLTLFEQHGALAQFSTGEFNVR